jgi:predicted AlkP superfamily phosphohydrolase/phosphomutase
MEHKPWDLFVVVYTATDKVQHHFWKYIDSSRPESHTSQAYGKAVFRVYEEIDKGIGELLEAAGDASVVIMSDHGAGPSSRRTMYINRWLNTEGFLHFKGNAGVSRGLGHLKYLLIERTNNEIKRVLPRRAKEVLLRLFPNLRDKVDSVLFLPGIDWSRTVAYSRENHPAIFINTKGREVEGIVEPGESYERVRDQIVDRLSRLRCPETGKPIAGKIFRREEVYQGPESFKAPDIIFQWNEYRYVHRPSGVGTGKPFFETLDDRALLASENTTRPSGIHRDYGVFIGFGKPFKSNHTFHGARIFDLAPTVLYLLGLAVPVDMDGRCLQETIEESYLRENPFKTVATGDAETSDAGRFDFELEEARAVEERLRGLGYID